MRRAPGITRRFYRPRPGAPRIARCPSCIQARRAPEVPPLLPIVDPFHRASPRPDASLAERLRATLAELDRFGVERAGISLDDDPELARAALSEAPSRFFARTEADPRRGMEELRRIERLARDGSLRAVTLSPARLFLPVDHAHCAPLFAKCVELDLAVCPSLGVPVERVPFAPQKVERIDPVACFHPELRIVMRGGCEPWQALAVLLMQRHPNLFFSGARLPAELAAFASDAGHHQVLFSSDATHLERAAKGLPELSLSEPAWPRFLRENAARVFRL